MIVKADESVTTSLFSFVPGALWRAGLIFVGGLFVFAGCKSSPTHPSCTNNERVCPVGTQRECNKTDEPCNCHCRSLSSNPFSPEDIEDQNRFGFPKQEQPSNQELQGPFGD